MMSQKCLKNIMVCRRCGIGCNSLVDNQFLIWNLSEKSYNYSKFQNQVCLLPSLPLLTCAKILEFGFPDHHNPPLDLLFEIVLSMARWTQACSGNVAVVHCKVATANVGKNSSHFLQGGKGRTGTVIACYLNFIGLFSDPLEALEFFGAKRSIIEKGVTQPSQRRLISGA